MVRGVVKGRIRAFLPHAGLNVVGVRDVARGHLLALSRGRPGERYILGGADLPLRDAFAIVAAAVGRRAPSVAVPWGVPYALARGADGLSRTIGHDPGLLVLDEVKVARHPMFYSSEKAGRALGYRPASPADALAEAARWFASVPPSRPPASWRIRLAASGSESIGSGGSAR